MTIQTVGGIVDPLGEITNENDERFVAPRVNTLVHVRARGPRSFPIDITSGTKSVRAYLACKPDATFRVKVGKAFNGPCSSSFQNFADIPPAGAKSVSVRVPSNTEYVLLIISTPESELN